MRRLAPFLPVLLLAGCAPTRPAEPAGHPGFDTWSHPGEEVLAAWREASPYRWIGFYLPAPCHRETSWSGTRERLERLGWGIAVLYVGQQAFDGVPDEEADGPIVCSRTLLTEEQGRADGLDAAERAEAEGFAPGTIIFLNVERTEEVSDSLAAYVEAWAREVLADGRARPGLYAHRRNAARLFPLLHAAAQEAGLEEVPALWVAGSGGFGLEHAPRASGVPYAAIWQGTHDVEREWGGVRLRIDENVAARPSPSAPVSRPAGARP